MAITISGSGITSANIADGTITTDDILASDVNSLKSGRKNLIINGGFQVSQRGDYTTATAMVHDSYFLDRWKCNVSGVTGTLQDTTNKVKLVATSSATGYLRIIQLFEVAEINKFAGQQVTFSAKVTSNSSDARLLIYADGWTSTSSHSGGGTEETLSITITVPSGGVSNFFTYVGINGVNAASVSITSGDYAEISGVQLELGSVATDFEHRSYGEELALCQRYYQASDAIGWTNLATSHYNGIYFSYPVVMRANPTLTIRSTSTDTASKIYWGDGTADVASRLYQNTNRGSYVGASNVSTGSGSNMSFKFRADAEL